MSRVERRRAARRRALRRRLVVLAVIVAAALAGAVVYLAATDAYEPNVARVLGAMVAGVLASSLYREARHRRELAETMRALDEQGRAEVARIWQEVEPAPVSGPWSREAAARGQLARPDDVRPERPAEPPPLPPTSTGLPRTVPQQPTREDRP